jgi:hypothetical protein
MCTPSAMSILAMNLCAILTVLLWVIILLMLWARKHLYVYVRCELFTRLLLFCFWCHLRWSVSDAVFTHSTSVDNKQIVIHIMDTAWHVSNTHTHTHTHRQTHTHTYMRAHTHRDTRKHRQTDRHTHTHCQNIIKVDVACNREERKWEVVGCTSN